MARKNWMKKVNKKRRAASRRRLGCESLEDRRVLATLTVTSLADAGAGSLRDAIATSNANGEDDTILFDASVAGGTVSLTSGALTIGETGFATTITGSGETLDAGGTSGVVVVDDGDGYVQTAGVVATISNVTITGGDVSYDSGSTQYTGGGIQSGEELILDNVTITGNTGDFGAGVANAGGLLTVTDSMITNNVGQANGGGLYATGMYHDTTITNTTISGNSTGSFQNGPYASTGGGVRITDGTTTITNSTLSGNTSDTTGTLYDYGGYGGNLYATGYATVNIVDSDLLNGIATSGDGASGRGGNLQVGGYANVTVDNTTIDGGSSAPGGGLGGNILFGGTSLTITNNSVVSGGTGMRGGGLYAFAGGSVLIDGGSTVSGNTATLFGGGITVAPGGDVTLDAAVISGNTVDPASGLPWGGGAFVGGAYGTPAAVLNVTNGTVFDGNSAPGNGGAIGGLPLGTAASGEPDVPWMNVNISDSTLSNNSAGNDGGAVHTPRGGQLSVSGSTLTGNTAVGDGGALRSFGYGCGVGAISGYQAICAGTTGTGETITNVINSTFDNNSGQYGHIVGSQYVGDPDGDGAVEFFDGPSVVTITGSTLSNSTTSGGIDVTQSSLTLIESTISGNTIATDGGGVGLFVFTGYGGTNTYFFNSQNSTITDNDSGLSGGGIYSSYYGEVNLTGTIVSGNTQVTGGDVYGGAATSTAVDTLIGNATLSAFQGLADGVLIGDTGSPVDALLGPLANNGGPTPTHLPLTGSPAIDANVSNTSATDQRGAARPFGAAADIGSVEAGASVPVDVDCDFDGDGNCDGTDIDALQADAVAGLDSPQFDLDGDGDVDMDDRDQWLFDAGVMNGFPTTGYLPGDFNLDGSVDVSDFNIWNGNVFTANSAWTAGDYTLDGFVDVSDFNIWNANVFTAASVVDGSGNFDTPRAAGAEFAGSVNTAPAAQVRAEALQNKLEFKTTFEGEIAQKAINQRSISVQGLANAEASSPTTFVSLAEIETSDVPAANTIGVNSVEGTKATEATVNSGYEVESTADNRLRVAQTAQIDAVFANLGGL